MSEETTLRILKDVARMSVPDDDCGYWCPLCNEGFQNGTYSEIDEVKHTPDCAILLARKELRERGVLLQVYSITGNHIAYRDCNNRAYWAPFQAYTLAAKDEVLLGWQGGRYRNVQAAYVRELKPEEGGIDSKENING